MPKRRGSEYEKSILLIITSSAYCSLCWLENGQEIGCSESKSCRMNRAAVLYAFLVRAERSPPGKWCFKYG
jgi:hypothetical protein